MMMQIADFAQDVKAFEDGKEAIDVLEPLMRRNEIEQLPDLIMVDLNMPIMDGWQFIEAFTQIPCKKQIILYIVSSSIDPNDRQRAASYSQVSGYLLKPITRDVLRSISKEQDLVSN
jgi:CheY-like chemotaxis protein